MWINIAVFRCLLKEASTPTSHRFPPRPKKSLVRSPRHGDDFAHATPEATPKKVSSLPVCHAMPLQPGRPAFRLRKSVEETYQKKSQLEPLGHRLSGPFDRGRRVARGREVCEPAPPRPDAKPVPSGCLGFDNARCWSPESKPAVRNSRGSASHAFLGSDTPPC